MTTRNSTPINQPAGADLRTKEYAFGKLVGGLAVACSALGERADFLIGNAPNTGEATDLYTNKICKAKIGAAPVALNAELTPDATGFAVTAVLGNVVRCKAMSAGAIGETIRVLWVDAYVKP